MDRCTSAASAFTAGCLEMQETKPEAPGPPHKETPMISSNTTTGRAGYLMLSPSTDDLLHDSDGAKSKITETAVALEDWNSSEPDGRRSRFPGRGFLHLGRQVVKFFRRQRPSRKPRGLRRSFSRGDLVEDDYPSKLESPMVRTVHVEDLDGNGDEDPRIFSSSSDTTRPRPSSRLVNALDIEGINRFHTLSDYDVGVVQGAHTTVSEDASDGRLQVSSTYRFPYPQQLPTNGKQTLPRTPPDTNSLSLSHISEDPPVVPPRLSVRVLQGPRIQAAPWRGSPGLVHQTCVTPLRDQMVDSRSSQGSPMKSSHRSHTRSIWDPLHYRELLWHGWYWGSLKREEATEKLRSQPVGTFLIRDCSDQRHLFAVSFVGPHQQVKHSLVMHSLGKWSFYNDMTRSELSVVQLVERSVLRASIGIPTLIWDGGVTFLTNPLSRFKSVKPLQHHCRFVIRLCCRIDLIPELPLPTGLKEYLKQDIM